MSIALAGLGRRLRSSARLVALVRGLRGFVTGRVAPPATPRQLEDHVRELIDAEFAASDDPRPRLNLLIPTVAANRTFGGVRTALDLFEALADGLPNGRIISVTPLPPGPADLPPGYEPTGPAADRDGRTIVSLRGPDGGGLSIRRDDAFVATFWTTAELAGRIRRWQDATFGPLERPIAYVIQDFEPSFYPWSAQWLLARGTYESTSPTVAIFNTALLQAYVHEQGHRFEHEFVFEPRLAPGLREAPSPPPPPRVRRIVLYGRPGTPRNAFPLAVDGLRAWAASDPTATTWTVVSAGELHPPIDLGRGLRLESVGKLGLAAYATLLRTSAVGLALMISPHPSYPPLEMAHLGMLVLTNRFAGKDLERWHENVRSLDALSAATIADGLTELCRRFEADPLIGQRGRSLRPEFLDPGPPYPFAAEVARLLGMGSGPTSSEPRSR